MKNFFETFLTSIILTLMILIVVMLVSLESSVVTARQVHSEAWHMVEMSEILNDDDVVELEDQINNALKAKHKGWHVTIERLLNSTARPYYLVTLNYKIALPIINVTTKGEIKAYAK